MKPLLVMYCPINIFSGYGSRARDLAHSLIKLKEPEFEVKFISCAWGNCSPDALDPTNETDKILIDRILPNGQMPRQPDIWIMCTVPNEMQKIGKSYNILITAGMESTICLPEWIEGCNKADLVIVSSNHAKKVFEGSVFENIDNNTKKVISVVKLKTKCEVLFEGVNNDIYQKIEWI